MQRLTTPDLSEPLAGAVVAAAGQPATVRLGTILQISPTLQIDMGGTVLDPAAVGINALYRPRVGDVVALLGQSVEGADTSGSTWLLLGSVSPATAGNWATQMGFDQTGFTTNSVAYTTAGVISFCFTPFIVPPSGRVLLHWSAEIHHGTSFCLVSPQIATGAAAGAGTVIVGATDDRTVRNDATAVTRSAHTDLITGLTPFQQLNCTLYHRVGAGTGTIGRRRVVVQPVY